MDETPITDVCVVFALRRESLFFRRQRYPVLLLETGVGSAAADNAIRTLLARQPKLVLSAGFSGALHPLQRVGDLVLATEFMDAEGNVWPATWPGEERPNWTRGRLLTMPTLVGDPVQKRQLGQQYNALAVDMETAVLARACQQSGVPFGALRVISDDLSTPLSPRLVDVLQTGRVAPLRLAGALLRAPGMIRELWQLRAHTNYAARQLALGLGEMLRL